MRLGTSLLYESRTLPGAHPKLADFCSALLADFYTAVDSGLYDQSVLSKRTGFLQGLTQVRKLWLAP